MSESTMSWEELKQESEALGFLAKQLFAITTVPANGLGPVLEVLQEHAAWQVHLEEIGVMWAAGPLANDAEDAWDGEGFFVYQADSKAEAIRYAEADPMHSSGARTFTVRRWMLNEGSFQVRINYSTGRVQLPPVAG